MEEENNNLENIHSFGINTGDRHKGDTNLIKMINEELNSPAVNWLKNPDSLEQDVKKAVLEKASFYVNNGISSQAPVTMEKILRELMKFTGTYQQRKLQALARANMNTSLTSMNSKGIGKKVYGNPSRKEPNQQNGDSANPTLTRGLDDFTFLYIYVPRHLLADTLHDITRLLELTHHTTQSRIKVRDICNPMTIFAKVYNRLDSSDSL